MDIINQNQEILLIFIIFGLILMVMLVVSVLKLPRIAKYLKANLKIQALRAKQEGVNPKELKAILNEADAWILADNDFKFEKKHFPDESTNT